jgi:hypothetical protein
MKIVANPGWWRRLVARVRLAVIGRLAALAS